MTLFRITERLTVKILREERSVCDDNKPAIVTRPKDCELIYIKRTNVMQLGSTFICNCNIALHVSDAFCVHHQENLETVEAASGE